MMNVVGGYVHINTWMSKKRCGSQGYTNTGRLVAVTTVFDTMALRYGT